VAAAVRVGARAGAVLALDVEGLDLANRRGRVVGKGGQVEK
jgi:hypothetical protein